MRQEITALLRDLQEAEPAPGAERLAALSDLDDKELGELRQAWASLASERRLALLEQLRQLGDDRIELTFEKINRFALNDPAPEVRRQAIGNLWECEDPALVPLLAQMLTSDPEPDVRQAAASALGLFVYLGEVERIPSRQLQMAEEALLEVSARDPDLAVRLACLESLGFSSRSEISPLIDAAYQSGEEQQVRAALVAMGRSANAAWAPAVTAELASPAPRLRLEAARAAGELELRETVRALVELLDDVDEGVRRAAIWSLGQLGGQQAEHALQALQRRKPTAEEARLLEEALENLAFVDGTRNFLMLDFDGDLEDEH